MKCVLIVDDSEAVRLRLAEHLTALVPGIAITQAATASEGMKAFMADDFDLTFLDGVFLDGTPAGDVLRAMVTAKPTLRVVLHSSRPREDPEISQALGVGAYAFLPKPVRRAAVEEIILRVESDEGRVTRIR